MLWYFHDDDADDDDAAAAHDATIHTTPSSAGRWEDQGGIGPLLTYFQDPGIFKGSNGPTVCSLLKSEYFS